MYHGKRCKDGTKRKLLKPSILMLALIVMTVCVVGSSLAYLVADTTAVVNTFTPGSVSSEVKETFENGTKKDVTIKNTGNTDAYIRAMVVITWKDTSGNVYGASQPVAGTDYTISYGTGWTLGSDGFWYYNEVVAAGESTAVLIESCEYTANAPDGYTLSVEIIADAIQESAVYEAWGVTPIASSNSN